MKQTDAEIIGSLREDILAAKAEGEILSPEEWEKELEIMINANFMGQPEHMTSGELELWNRIMAEPIRKRVPRAWWGWSVIAYRKIKSSLKRLRLWVWIFLIGLAVVGVCGHSTYLWLIGL